MIHIGKMNTKIKTKKETVVSDVSNTQRSEPIVISVLMTSYNRRETTLKCLERLYTQSLPSNVTLQVFLVDDGCSDGTGAAVKVAHPDVNVIQGDGSLFWCNGMRLAWEHAEKDDPDFYLWLNDDSMLLTGAVKSLVFSWTRAKEQGGADTIVVGSCRDPETGQHSYGGQCRPGKHPGKLESVFPKETPVECDTFEGNVVLVPRAVYLKVGNMRSFHHAMGDTDYGHRAKKCGCGIMVAPRHLAECEMNLAENVFENESLNFSQRLVILLKRIPPKDWWLFLKAHAGLRAVFYFPLVYVRFMFNGARGK